MAALPLASCMSDVDDPDTDGYLITSPTSIGEVNSTIGEVKDKYCSAGSSNFYERVNEDVIIEGVVVANDEGGNLYQTLLIRSIDEAAGTDQCIVLAVKNTCLYPIFHSDSALKSTSRDFMPAVTARCLKSASLIVPAAAISAWARCCSNFAARISNWWVSPT